jgi:hypothetical protein
MGRYSREGLGRFWGRALIIAIAFLTSHSQPARAQSSLPSGLVNYAVEGQRRFNAGRYDEAIDLYRRHLRRVPTDANVWTQLGAAYYHTGQPRRGLRALKYVERRVAEKTYNYYYQGLCYLALEQLSKAKEYWAFIAVRYTDEYAGRATFELAAQEYNARNKPKAQYWAGLYLQRYPAGVYAAQAQKVLQNLREDKFEGPIEGAKKPDLENALYKYNSLSLMNRPHYWFLQGGFNLEDIAGQEPEPGGKLKGRNIENINAIANAGIGAGPYKEGDVTASGGYSYRQTWITDQDRIAEYTDDPSNPLYFPFRGDLLMRQHQLYGQVERDVAGLFFFGAFARYEIARMGSSIYPGPDNQELKRVIKISETQTILPWIGASYNGNMRTMVYFYMRKELNDDAPEYSNKTYDLGITGGRPVMSYGVSHEMEFPEEQTSVDVELFQYEFIYNDPWLDYTRRGLIVSAEHELVPRWFVSGALGYYQDQYQLQRLKQNPCGSSGPGETPTGTAVEDPNAPPVPHACDRKDVGLLYQLGVYWNWSQFQRISFTYQVVDNRNPEQKEFDESKQSYGLLYTLAFPSVKRVTRLVDRYDDSAFTKEPE